MTRSRDDLNKNNSGQTIGLAVGLGVGIPIFLTVLVLALVTVRHRRKAREEDQQHEAIDFNGDVSFDNTGCTIESKDEYYISHHNGLPVSKGLRRPSQFEDGSSTLLYTPDMPGSGTSAESWTRSLNSVYGPSPMYPSTDRLRAPSTIARRGSLQSTGGSSMGGPRVPTPQRPYGTMYTPEAQRVSPSPFDTPPRRRITDNDDRSSSTTRTPESISRPQIVPYDHSSPPQLPNLEIGHNDGGHIESGNVGPDHVRPDQDDDSLHTAYQTPEPSTTETATANRQTFDFSTDQQPRQSLPLWRD